MFESASEFRDKFFNEITSRGDFPSVSESVWRIVAVMDTEEEQFNLTNAILADPLLTQKVLRAANSAKYHRFGQLIRTVTQAVLVLGYDQVGHLALGNRLEGGIALAANSGDRRSRKALAESSLTGAVARNIALKVCPRLTEEVVVCSLMHSMGRILVMFYLPKSWDTILTLSKNKKISESSAFREVTHMSESNVSKMLAEHWKMPKIFLDSFEKPQKNTAPTHAQWLGVVAGSSAAITKRIVDNEGCRDEETLMRLAEEFSDQVGISADEVRDVMTRALAEEELSLSVIDAKDSQAEGKVLDAVERLQALCDTLVAESSLHSIRSLMGMAMESFHYVFGARRVLLLLREPKGEHYLVRFSVGDASLDLKNNLTLEVAYAPDVFHLALLRNSPVLISDAKKMRENGKLPAKYLRQIGDDPAFLILPIGVLKQPLGVLYLDWKPGVPVASLSDRESVLLLTIRDLLVEAILSRRRPAGEESLGPWLKHA